MAEGAGGAAPLARALRALALACADTIRSARGAFNSTARAEAAVRQMRAALPASVLRDGEGEDGAERTLGALADELAAAAVASAVSDGGWRASAAAATAAAAEQPSAGARAHDADPLAVPGHACVRAYGVTLPSSGHPRMNGVVSLFDGHRVRVRRARARAPTRRARARAPHADRADRANRHAVPCAARRSPQGEHVTLDDGLSAISASDAIMWCERERAPALARVGPRRARARAARCAHRERAGRRSTRTRRSAPADSSTRSSAVDGASSRPPPSRRVLFLF